MSSSLCSSIRALVPHYRRQKNPRFFVLLPSKRYTWSPPRFVACLSNDDSLALPKPVPLAFDPSEELFGLGVDLKPRNSASSAPEPRSWFGPNGQYIKELPCPSCRGRGYAPCTECGIERSRADCSVCNGKGIVTCHQCLGDRVIWEESIDEQPWEKARSSSPLRMKEDDEVDNLEIKLEEKKKSKRVYQSPPPEVGLKISRSLKSLNAKTGLFSKRMKIIHRDPTLHAQRVAAIKKAKGSAEARKRTSESLKAFFSDPENRRKRSISMKGVKFYCKNCGREGHRRHYCPELEADSADTGSRCGRCGEKGHNIRSCTKSTLNRNQEDADQEDADQEEADQEEAEAPLRPCRICHASGHSSRHCPTIRRSNPSNNASGTNLTNADRGMANQNRRVIPTNADRRMANQNRRVRRQYHCEICGERDHSRQNCPDRDRVANHGHYRIVRAYHCSICNELGHNRRTCARRNPNPRHANR